MGMTDRGDSIEVLHVDDEPGLAEVAAEFLVREDDRLSVKTATSTEAALEQLGDDVDCVVSDYDMPGRNGVEFLRRVRERYPDLPFILFTGKGSEEVASEAISAGVTDYLQKESGSDQYAVLANRIRNVVSAARTARESEHRRHRLEQILKTVPACVVQIDYDGRFVFANRRAEEVLGLEQSAVTDRTYNDPAWDITDLDGEPIPDERLPFRQVRDSGEPIYGFRHTIEWPDGTRKVLLVNGAPLFGDDGTVESTVFALTDITGKQELERDQSLYKAAFDNAFDAIVITADDGDIVEVNESATDLFGLSAEALRGRSAADFAPESADFDAAWEDFLVGESERARVPFVRPDGAELVVEYAATLDIVPGYHVSILRDVTEESDDGS